MPSSSSSPPSSQSSSASKKKPTSSDDDDDDDDDTSTIRVYLRIRPHPPSPRRKSPPERYFSRDDLDDNRLIFQLPSSSKSHSHDVNNTKTRHAFRFNGIIDHDASQDDVFKIVGLPALNNAIDGFNSTVFAYGQTGSGKTFTITGGPQRYVDRGIIPRTISHLFSEFQRRSHETTYTCFVSYLELYNENGYDLLASDLSETTDYSQEETPKVTMLENDEGRFHFRNLSIHQVGNEEEETMNLAP